MLDSCQIYNWFYSIINQRTDILFPLETNFLEYEEERKRKYIEINISGKIKGKGSLGKIWLLSKNKVHHVPSTQ